MPEHRVLKADLGKEGRYLLCGIQITAPDHYPNQYETKSSDKNPRQNEVEDNVKVRIGRATVAEDADNPEAN